MARKKSDVGAPRHVGTTAELAVAIGRSLPMLDRYLAAGLPLSGPPYDVAAVAEWVRQNVRPRTGRAADDEAEPILRKRNRLELQKMREDVRSKKRRNDKDEARLLPAEEVTQWVAQAFLRIRQRLEKLPDDLQVLVPSALRPEFRAAAEKKVHALLTEMSDWQLQLDAQHENAAPR